MSALGEVFRYLGISLFRNIPSDPIESQKEVYISLTTLPDRIHKIKPVLISLLDQSIPAKTIFLNVPKKTRTGEPFPIPEELNQIPRLQINYIPKDLGPGTKFLPLLKDPRIPDDALLIVLDDDQVYPKNLIECYLQATADNPHCAFSLCGWSVPETLKHSDKMILRGAGLKLFNPSSNIKKSTSVDVIQGASSYAIKKQFFDDSVFDYSDAPKGAFFADDIWISGHLAKRGVPRMVLKSNLAYCRLHALSHFSTQGLRDTANADNSNNDALYTYFEAYW